MAGECGRVLLGLLLLQCVRGWGRVETSTASTPNPDKPGEACGCLHVSIKIYRAFFSLITLATLTLKRRMVAGRKKRWIILFSRVPP